MSFNPNGENECLIVGVEFTLSLIFTGGGCGGGRVGSGTPDGVEAVGQFPEDDGWPWRTFRAPIGTGAMHWRTR